MLDIRLATASALLAAVLVLGAVSAQQTSPSVPGIPVDGSAVPLEQIPDLHEAPPIAISSIILLVELGVYPLEAGLHAQPNLPTSEEDLAFMLINLFMPGATGEFPADRESAFGLLKVIAAERVSANGKEVVTGERFLPLLLRVLDLDEDEEEALVERLIAALPAWQIGNFAAPLTRAATALLLATTVYFLYGSGS